MSLGPFVEGQERMFRHDLYYFTVELAEKYRHIAQSMITHKPGLFNLADVVGVLAESNPNNRR